MHEYWDILQINLYPNIAALEICTGTLLLSVLFFHDDRFKGITFSIKYKLTVIGLSLGILLVTMVLLEKFYENPSNFTGLGYSGIHLLLNAAAIAGLIFAPNICSK